jgi:hypothetical protein
MSVACVLAACRNSNLVSRAVRREAVCLGERGGRPRSLRSRDRPPLSPPTIYLRKNGPENGVHLRL